MLFEKQKGTSETPKAQLASSNLYFFLKYPTLSVMKKGKIMPTQRDVARIAGVSSASVSRFITDPGNVRAETAQRVKKAIAESGYKVDQSARILRTGRSYHVGILLPGIGPFYWEILQGIQDHLTRSGYFSTIFYTRDIDSSIHNTREKLSNFLNNKLIEGVIFFPLLNTEVDAGILKHLRQLHENLVIADREMEDCSLDQIYIDNGQAGGAAADALLAEGHERMLFIHGKKDSYAAVKRCEGFLARLREAGVPWSEERIIHGDYTSETSYLLARRCLPSLPPFTGVFAVNDATAIGFLRAAREYGLRCPQDFSLIGFDNNREFTPYMDPPLSTFQQPLNELGHIAAMRIIKQIEGDLSPGHTVLRANFVRRESLGSIP
ncbi:MAG: hypothetical protein B0D92_03355 [Spirochaeta sp. LUC14_002_19_P3]|nr:MAG: hypothetical protein B0D92_03355 [Spirochaeta sp. LUC14_002_19_P3]